MFCPSFSINYFNDNILYFWRSLVLTFYSNSSDYSVIGINKFIIIINIFLLSNLVSKRGVHKKETVENVWLYIAVCWWSVGLYHCFGYHFYYFCIDPIYREIIGVIVLWCHVHYCIHSVIYYHQYIHVYYLCNKTFNLKCSQCRLSLLYVHELC